MVEPITVAGAAVLLATGGVIGKAMSTPDGCDGHDWNDGTDLSEGAVRPSDFRNIEFDAGGVYMKHQVKQRCQKDGCNAKRKKWKTVYKLCRTDLYGLKEGKRVIIDEDRHQWLLDKEEKLENMLDEDEDNE